MIVDMPRENMSMNYGSYLQLDRNSIFISMEDISIQKHSPTRSGNTPKAPARDIFCCTKIDSKMYDIPNGTFV